MGRNTDKPATGCNYHRVDVAAWERAAKGMTLEEVGQALLRVVADGDGPFAAAFGPLKTGGVR